MKPALRRTLRSIFNTANLAGLGAIGLSVGAGSAAGTAFFAAAVVTGTLIKYRSLVRAENGEISRAGLLDPALTAKLLMGATGLNLLNSIGEAAMGPADRRLHMLFNAAMWGFGLLGDDALRRLDTLNFKNTFEKAAQKTHSAVLKLRHVVDAVLTNPALFYNGANASAAAMLLSDTAPTAPEYGVGAGVIGLALGGAVRAAHHARKAHRGELGLHDINDGALNKIVGVSNIGLGALAALSGNGYLSTAYFIFALSMVTAHFETRAAVAVKSPPIRNDF